MGAGYKWVIHFKMLPFTASEQGDLCLSGVNRKYLTKKGEVTKKSSEQVHDKHGQDGDVGNSLHAFLGGTVKASRKK